MERHVHTAVDPASTLHNEAQTGGTVLPLLQKPGDLVIPDGQQQAAPGANFICDPNDTIIEDIQDCYHGVEQTDTPHMPAFESHQAVLKHVGKASQPEMAANILSGRIDDACHIGPATPCLLIPSVDVIPEGRHNERISQDLNETQSVGAIKLPEEGPAKDSIQARDSGDNDTSVISPADMGIQEDTTSQHCSEDMGIQEDTTSQRCSQASQLSIDGHEDFNSLSLPSDNILTDSQLAIKIDQICLRECHHGLDTQVNEGAKNDGSKKTTPLRRTHRRTKRPARFLSTPTLNNSPLQLLELLLADPNRFRSDIVKSFSARHMAKGMFIDAFADFLYKEDMSKRPHPAYNRIFIPTTISMILPIIHNDHWSLYIINHNQKSFDILDSKKYDLIGGTETQHHFPMAQKILKRLSDGFQVYMGGRFPKFGNYRRGYIKCPKMALGSNDSAFYVMRFMEKYNGDADKLSQAFPMVPSATLRGQILHHLIFNRFNYVEDLHHDIKSHHAADNAQ